MHKKKSRLLCKEGWWLLLSSGQGNIYFLLRDCAVFNACCFGSFKQMEIKAPIHHFNVSGKYRDGDENRLEKPPFAVCRDFAAAVEQICTMLWHCLVKCGSTAFSSQQSLPAFVFQPTVKLLLFFSLIWTSKRFSWHVPPHPFPFHKILTFFVLRVTNVNFLFNLLIQLNKKG